MDPREVIDSIARQYGLTRSGIEVLGTLLAQPYRTGSAIARLTGLSEATVSRWRRDPRLHRALIDLGGDIGGLPWRSVWRTRWECLLSRSQQGDLTVQRLQLQAMGILGPPGGRPRDDEVDPAEEEAIERRWRARIGLEGGPGGSRGEIGSG